MKDYDDRRRPTAAQKETEQVFDDFDAAQPERSYRDTPSERARKIARLKREVNSGNYKPDVMDIARLLTSAMDPTL